MVNHPHRARNRSAFLAAVLSRAFAFPAPPDPFLVERCVVAMQRAARAHQVAAMHEPNPLLTEAQQGRADKRLAGLAVAAKRALRSLGAAAAEEQHVAYGRTRDGRLFPVARLAFGGDRRGPCGWLYVAGEVGDTAGGGYAIYR